MRRTEPSTTDSSTTRPERGLGVPTAGWIAIVTLAVIASVFGVLYFTRDSSSAATPRTSVVTSLADGVQPPLTTVTDPTPASASNDDPAPATNPIATSPAAPADSSAPAASQPTGARIPSGTYALPGELSPGVYRVADWSLMDAEGTVIDSDAAIDGTVLLVIPDDPQPGSVMIRGGAARVDAGPVDPFQYRDGKYVVGVDIAPGTYRVTPATEPVDSLLLGRLDKDLVPLQIELSLSPASGESLTVEVLATDYAIQFEGKLEKVG